MRKKLQVFISSTYRDLVEERQAAVEAILNAGHIPAGMELFKAGNESQLETVKRWIDESDVYLLILGGRYGTMETSSGRSYTQVEYEYALDKDIPVFALVINEEALQEKVRKNGTDVIELEHQTAYKAFREQVLGKICRFYDDLKDIKLSVHETLADFQNRFQFTGWVSGKDIPDVEKLLLENIKLIKENEELKGKINKQKVQIESSVLINGLPYEEIKQTLANIMITFPVELSKDGMKVVLSVLDIFVMSDNYFATGVSNATGASKVSVFLFSSVAPKLLMYNLVERVKVTGVQWQRIHTSKDGLKFLALYHKEQKPLTSEVTRKVRKIQESK